jgi:hypothetical protein
MANPTEIAPVRLRMPVANKGSFSKDNPPRGRGRPAGSPNKLTRTMKDAAVAAAEELRQVPVSTWDKTQLEGDKNNGMKAYFKFLGVCHPKSFAVILARIMPLHVPTTSMPAYLTEEQALAELKLYGLPSGIIKLLHCVDESEIDKEDNGNYDEPESDEEQMANPTEIAPVRLRMPGANKGSFSEDNPPRGRGRPAGSPNKATRTMKDAAVAAAEELGQVPVSTWHKTQLEGDKNNGMKAYFKFLGVCHPKSFAIILARIMPLHVPTSTLPADLTEEQARAELRTYGLPENIIELLHFPDESELDKEQISDPWAHPEADMRR